MKTLDEVIEALARDEYYCSACPLQEYCEGVTLSCYIEDALHYLKWFQARDNMSRRLDIEDNPPLTWDELKQMEGKPVWVEEENQPSQWYLINEVETDEDDDPEFVSMTVFECQGGYWFYKNNMGTKWQAYRKERNEDAE